MPRNMNGNRNRDGEDERGLLWNLPVLKSSRFGNLGPAFGLGVGCGVGFGIGLVGGAGFGPGIPGLQLGFGLGAGCGVGLGFGYGVGRGIAQDDKRRYSNVGDVLRGHQSIFPHQDDIGALVDDLVLNTKRLIRATSREIDKWKR
ncbi:hypothetical protein IC582_020582 [Cucumis melo]|uniref:Glycine-rich cell wall structural protein 1 n=1 Tax=Cucumis melo TaxID=3656 RepID=A0A1S4E347_CUCME|nr:glycine-rich cell wall structural protein 1 [Cucumis melo]